MQGHQVYNFSVCEKVWCWETNLEQNILWLSYVISVPLKSLRSSNKFQIIIYATPQYVSSIIPGGKKWTNRTIQDLAC